MSEIQLWTIPTNWQWATMANIGEVVSGGTPSTKNPSFWGGAINWISPADLSGYNNKFIFKGAKSLTETGLENSSAKLMPAGSIHFSSRAPIGYVVISKTNISTSQGFKSIVPAKGIFNEYVYYFLKSAKRIAEERASGTTFKELSGKAFSELPIPIPPVDEQYRIVATIDELFSELDQGIESIKTCREHLNVYRQAVLKHAFEGKLTEKWRNAHADQLETAEQLLALIKQQREQRYQQQLEEWEKAVQTWEENGKQGGKPSKPQKLKEPSPLKEEELEQLPQLPEGWCWVRLGQLTWSVKDGPHYSPQYADKDKGIPFITGGNVRPEGIDFENVKYISKELHEELSKRCKPEVGDIIYTKGGTTGIARVNTYDFNFNVWVHIAILKIVDSIEPFYLQHSLNSFFCYSQAQKYTHGVGNQDLGLTRMINIVLSICSPSEQQKIVYLLEATLTTLERLAEIVEENLQKAEVLRYCILKKAFSGQLVSQDPNDEPATVLLERIRAEQEAVPKTTRKRVTTKKKEKTKMADLISVLESANAWLSAQNIFHQCGIGDGAETEAIETLYLELRDLLKEKRIEVERRDDEDWLRISLVKEG
ncbi:restriction endonuclease subunit S [Planktothrix agardhii]|uniref:restriction endonuclease subunit S n=1 Tax=Planktothrix agardhii TaxID=1160 RepID=UPI001D0B353E|nr:restriction endonuclease subunit S [Planktothrix agardhii]MCB8788926.1 restriction endonuclease subunit S [Planktothrix agardhii 1025]MCF3614226.1 restriction endonuclease subunit S [Planktothrix agardhii 1027]MCF3647845.1 restriction endonuclease subunit S [Planktothrix agardhii 1026]